MLDAIQKKEVMKIGRKNAAEILTHKNGHKILMVNRTIKDIVRGRGNVFISHAMENDEACWPVESILLSRARNRGVTFIAIRVRDDKSVYMSPLTAWINESRTFGGRRRNGSAQRILPFSFFAKKAGVVKV